MPCSSARCGRLARSAGLAGRLMGPRDEQVSMDAVRGRSSDAPAGDPAPVQRYFGRDGTVADV
jgi:hypothetical protein